jgi:hypothetical protein
MSLGETESHLERTGRVEVPPILDRCARDEEASVRRRDASVRIEGAIVRIAVAITRIEVASVRGDGRRTEWNRR